MFRQSKNLYLRGKLLSSITPTITLEAPLVRTILDIYPISDSSIESMINDMEYLEVPKGHILLKASKVENYIYFLVKGIARAFSLINERELTFWFGQEGSIILSYNSYIHGKPGYENIELLEDSKLFKLSISKIQQLYLEHIEIANWGRKLAEFELLKTEELFISRQISSATERYRKLLRTQPELLQRVRLGLIASYLGVTQVSLSRIRSEVKE